MSEAVLVALVTGGIGLVGTVISVVMSNRLTGYRIDQLEKKMDRHNNLVERMTSVERDVKTAYRLIDDLGEKVKER